MTATGPRPAFLLAVAAVVWLACVGLGIVAVEALEDDPPASEPPSSTIAFIDCAPGGVHAWLFPDGSGAVMPAGADCPEKGP